MKEKNFFKSLGFRIALGVVCGAAVIFAFVFLFSHGFTDFTKEETTAVAEGTVEATTGADEATAESEAEEETLYAPITDYVIVEGVDDSVTVEITGVPDEYYTKLADSLKRYDYTAEIYEIHFKDASGNEVSLSEAASVTIIYDNDIPNGTGSDYRAYLLDVEAMKATELACTADDEKASFGLTEGGVVAVVRFADSETTAESDEESGEDETVREEETTADGTVTEDTTAATTEGTKDEKTTAATTEATKEEKTTAATTEATKEEKTTEGTRATKEEKTTEATKESKEEKTTRETTTEAPTVEPGYEITLDRKKKTLTLGNKITSRDQYRTLYGRRIYSAYTDEEEADEIDFEWEDATDWVDKIIFTADKDVCLSWYACGGWGVGETDLDIYAENCALADAYVYDSIESKNLRINNITINDFKPWISNRKATITWHLKDSTIKAYFNENGHETVDWDGVLYGSDYN